MGQNEANELPKRKTMCLKGADYSATGAYFITICTHEKACIFGHIHDEEMCLNELGRVVNAVWNEIPLHYPQVQTDAWVVMPNHVHGIVFFQSPSSQSVEIVPHPCRPAPVGHSLGRVVGAYKGAVTQRIRRIGGECRNPVWQRNYYDHIVRDEDELCRIRQYIADNPLCWDEDHDNPVNQSHMGDLSDAWDTLV